MTTKNKAKTLIQKAANSMGYGIYKPPSLWHTLKPRSYVQKIANSLGYTIYKPPSLWHTMTPPQDIRSLVGPCNNPYYYASVGDTFLEYFKELCSLKPNEDVLDVGCGCGQMAAPLTGYLNRNTIYEGFDIVPEMINWCVMNITSKYPNFHFQLTDVFNKTYNPDGLYKASRYKFPYQEESFDFIFLKSVFTHMLPHDMENYLSEICRVLKKGKRCLISYFLLNEQSLELLNENLSTLNFNFAFTNYRTISESNLEDAVAYDEAYIHTLYANFGLEVLDCIYYGSWCGRRKYVSYQDIIIAIKV